MNQEQREAYAKARFYEKAFGGVVDEMKRQYEDWAFGLHAETGAKSIDMTVNGQKVGTASIVDTPEESEVTTRPEVVDQAAFDAWCDDNGCTRTVSDFGAAMRHFDETGELPDGVEMAEVRSVTKRGKRYVSTRLDMHKAFDAMRDELPQGMQRLLEGER